MPEHKITDLPDLISDLPPRTAPSPSASSTPRATTGRLEPPEAMRPWIEKSFGSVDAVTEQRIVKVTNRVTLDGTLFNELRASRPLDTGVSLDLDREIAATEGDPFCRPEEGTPADVFGRVRGEHAITASNVAKYDGFHGVVVFDDHNPLHLTPEKVSDYVAVGLEWFRQAHEADPEARYPFLMWNCLWRAGGSIIHGHAQVTATRGTHYPKVERLRRAAAALPRRARLGLLRRPLPRPRGPRPRRPRRGGRQGLRQPHAAQGEGAGRDRAAAAAPETRTCTRTVGALLESYVGDLGVQAFNVAFYMPPLAPSPEDWSDFPTVVHLVDRGSPANRTSDMGAMELYAAPVVASDPFRVAEALRG